MDYILHSAQYHSAKREFRIYTYRAVHNIVTRYLKLWDKAHNITPPYVITNDVKTPSDLAAGMDACKFNRHFKYNH